MEETKRLRNDYTLIQPYRKTEAQVIQDHLTKWSSQEYSVNKILGRYSSLDEK
jgi:hypothetical protein